MSKPAAKKKPTKAELARMLKEAKAQQIHVCHFADQYLAKMGNFQASGIMVELTALGGREIIPPIVISNGLSQETIDALRKDILRTYQYKTELKPKA